VEWGEEGSWRGRRTYRRKRKGVRDEKKGQLTCRRTTPMQPHFFRCPEKKLVSGSIADIVGGEEVEYEEEEGNWRWRMVVKERKRPREGKSSPRSPLLSWRQTTGAGKSAPSRQGDETGPKGV